MAFTVNGAFAEFLRGRVNLDSGDTVTARAGQSWLFGQIAGFQTDAIFPKPYAEYDISFGSFARHTKTRPLDDIDVMSCLSAQGATYEAYSDRIDITVEPGTNLAALCFDYTHRLNSIKVINKFLRKLEGVPQYSSAGLKRNGAAAVLSLKSYDWCFDIVPCFMMSPEFDGRTYYLIPNGNGDWKKTDPRIDRDRVRRINKLHDGHVLDVIRIIKYWNKRPTMPSMSAYLIEAVILKYYESQLTTASQYVDVEIPRILDHISSAIYGPVLDPKNIQGDINSLTWEDRSKIGERAGLDQEKALDARRLESNDDQKGSINKWREIFGGDFPIYG
ncbi:MAG: hypothetical protein WKF34_07130 [Pyrinomonadaceae bacterium]